MLHKRWTFIQPDVRNCGKGILKMKKILSFVLMMCVLMTIPMFAFAAVSGDEPLTIGSIAIPLFRPGLRMVVFSLLLMIVVLFYSRGLMGTTELTWDRVFGWVEKLKNKKAPVKGGAGK